LLRHPGASGSPQEPTLAAARYQRLATIAAHLTADVRGSRVRLLTSPDGGALLRVIAGELDGHRGPGATHTPITLIHATVRRGAQLTLPWAEESTALAYVLAGRGSVGAERRPIRTGQAALFGAPASRQDSAQL
jgi:redox-sensitive bicupin YhaK (pirin superfamily)